MEPTIHFYDLPDNLINLISAIRCISSESIGPIQFYFRSIISTTSQRIEDQQFAFSTNVFESMQISRYQHHPI